MLFLSAILLLTPAAYGATITVPTMYSSIQAAINAASPGDTILVDSGVYKENIVVNKTIVLKGNDTKVMPLIDGNGVDAGVKITAENVTVQGFRVANSRWGIEIDSNNNNVTGNTINDNVYGFYLIDGIILNYASNNTVSGNTVNTIEYFYYNSNADDFDCILLKHSSNNTISGNTANNYRHGIVLDSSSNNTVSGNTANGNDYRGIYSWGSSSNNTVSGNTASNNKGGPGIYLSGLGNNTVSGNTASNNTGGPGIYLSGPGNNTVSWNTANNNYADGIRLDSSSNNTVTWNTANDNNMMPDSNGISIAGSNNTVSWNTAYSNSNNGIDLQGSNNTVLGNTANGVFQGIMLSSGSNNMLSGNTATILLTSSSNNTVSGNTANYGPYGIRISASSNNTVSGNTANNNYYYGIYIYESSDNNTVSENTVNYNTAYGIYIRESNNNNVSENTVNHNLYGIYLGGSSDNVLWLNIIRDNGQNVYCDDSPNHWNSTAMLSYVFDGQMYTNFTGNYWGDYAGDGVDGIGTTPYNISYPNNVDHYPMILSSGPTPSPSPSPSPGPKTGPVRNLNTGSYYQTIQAAINSASPEDTILVDGGVYNENVVINRTIILEGNDTNGMPVIDGNGGDAVKIMSNGVTVKGFNVTNGKWGILIYSSINNVTGNTVNNNVEGVVIYGTLGIYRMFNNVTGNTVNNNTQDGIVLQMANNNNVTGNMVNNNTCSGISLGTANNNNVTGNTVNNNYDGIYLHSSSNNVFWLNIIQGNGQNAYCDDGLPNRWNSTTMLSYTFEKQAYRNFTGNYWGDFVGDGMDGIGTTPYNITYPDDVDYYPMILKSSPSPIPLVASFTANATEGKAPLTVQLNDTSVGYPETWNWSFGDGSGNATTQNATYTYDDPGIYQVNLTVSNVTRTSTASATITVTDNEVQPVIPVAGFSANVTSGMAPLDVLFTDNSTGSPTSRDWNFGDGSDNSSGASVTHTFGAGSYTVTMTASNDNGSSTVRKAGYITVSSTAPIAYTVNLKKGWNLISFPVANSSIAASSLGGIGVTDVARFNNTAKSYDVFMEGISTEGYDFNLTNQHGYFIKCGADTSFSVTGIVPDSGSSALCGGWNVVGWNNLTGTDAIGVCTRLPAVTDIARYNTTLQDFDVYMRGVSTAEYSFAIHDGEGYFVKTSGDLTFPYGGY